MPSLGQILLVAHDAVRVELWQRTDAGDWSRSVHGEGDVLLLPALGCELDVDSLYRDNVDASGTLVRP